MLRASQGWEHTYIAASLSHPNYCTFYLPLLFLLLRYSRILITIKALFFGTWHLSGRFNTPVHSLVEQRVESSSGDSSETKRLRHGSTAIGNLRLSRIISSISRNKTHRNKSRLRLEWDVLEARLSSQRSRTTTIRRYSVIKCGIHVRVILTRIRLLKWATLHSRTSPCNSLACTCVYSCRTDRFLSPSRRTIPVARPLTLVVQISMMYARTRATRNDILSSNSMQKRISIECDR